MTSLETKYNRIEKIITVLAVLVGIFFGYAGISVLDRRQVLEFTPNLVTPSPIIPGQYMYVNWTVTKRREGCGGVVHRYLTMEDSRTWKLDDAPVSYHPGTDASSFVREVRLPETLPDGIVYYHVDATRWCNEFQHFIWPMDDHSIIPVRLISACPAPRDLARRCTFHY